MNVVITHCLSDSNKGVLAVLLVAIRKIREHFPDARIGLHSLYRENHTQFEFHSRFLRRENIEISEGILPSPYLDDTANGTATDILAILRLLRLVFDVYSLEYLPRKLRRMLGKQGEAFESLKNADLILMKGGQDFYNDTGLRSYVYIWRMLKIISICTSVNVPVVILGQSIGDIRGRRVKQKLRDTLQHCSKVVVRDEISRDVLAKIGLKHNVIHAPDLGFLIDPSSRGAQFLPQEGGGWIGVTVVNGHFGAPQKKASAEIMKRYVAALIETLTIIYNEYGVAPLLIAQNLTMFHGVDDLQLIRELESILRKKGIPVHTIDQDLEPSELAYVYGFCAVVLGTRFHSCVLAAAAGTPIVAIEYHGTKTRGLMRSLELENFMHELNALDAESLTESIRASLDRGDEIRDLLHGKTKSARTELGNVISNILLEHAPDEYIPSLRDNARWTWREPPMRPLATAMRSQPSNPSGE